MRCFSFVALCVAAFLCVQCSSFDKEILLVGSYTSAQNGVGFRNFSFDDKTGELAQISGLTISNASYLTVIGKNAYVVTEQSEESSAITTVALERGAREISIRNRMLLGQSNPCFISGNDSALYVANYTQGSMSVVGLDKNALPIENVRSFFFYGAGSDTIRQKSPHVHCAYVMPKGEAVYATDLGTDRLYLLKDNQIDTFYVTPGSGPRHLEFSAKGDRAYLLNELSGTVMVFERDLEDGALTLVQEIQADQSGARGSGDIHLSADGRFLYSSHRLQNDGIAIFRVLDGGRLEYVGYQNTGVHPRNFVISPSGDFILVACKGDNSIEVYRRDKKSGLLSFLRKTKVHQAVCLKFVP